MTPNQIGQRHSDAEDMDGLDGFEPRGFAPDDDAEWTVDSAEAEWLAAEQVRIRIAADEPDLY